MTVATHICPVCNQAVSDETLLIQDHLELPNRILLILITSNLRTISDLEKKTDTEMLKYRNLGPHSLRIIRQAIVTFNKRYRTPRNL